MTKPLPALVIAACCAFLPWKSHAVGPSDDDLFTGTAETKNAKPEGKPRPATEWDALLATADVVPFEIPKSSKSFAQTNAEYNAWIRRKIVEPTRAMVKGTPDEKRINRLLDQFGSWYFDGRPIPTHTQALNAARSVANDPKLYPGLDYIVGYWLLRDDRKSAALKCYKKLAEAPADAPVPTAFRLVAQGYLFKNADNYDKKNAPAAEKRFFEILDKLAAEEITDEDDARFILRMHLFDPIETMRANREPRFMKLYQSAKWPDWMRLTLGGTSELAIGWREIGRDKVPVGQKAAESAKKHYLRARELLTEAWKLKPSEPAAAQRILYIIRQGFGEEDDTLRQWYERVIAAEIDDPFAANAMLFASRIRHGGSPSELLGLARAFRETERYDTDFPTFFNKAVSYLAMDTPDWRPIYRDSNLGRKILETREKRIASLDAKDARGNMNHNSMLLAEAWAVGDLAKAASAREALRNSKGAVLVSKEAADFCYNIDVDEEIAYAEAAVFGSPARDAWEKGRAAYGAAKFEEARAHFQAGFALVKIPEPAQPAVENPGREDGDKAEVAENDAEEKDAKRTAEKPQGDDQDKKAADPTAANLLEAEVALADFNLKYPNGDWTPLPLHLRGAWKVADGNMAWDKAKGRARFTSTWEFGKSLFRGALGSAFEVRGHFVTSRPPANKYGGFGVYFGHSAPDTGRLSRFWYSARVDMRSPNDFGYCVVPMYSTDPKDKKAKWNPDNTFLFRREGEKISFSVNGNAAFQRSVDAGAPSGEAAFGLGIIAFPENSFVDAWELEARKLPSP